MSGSNQFLPFATGGGANTLTPSAYAALATLLSKGFQAGVAQSDQMNTVLRQTTVAVSAIAQAIADMTGVAVNDDGVVANFENQFLAMLQRTPYIIATAGGSADALTAAFTPAITSLTNGLSLMVRASSANTSATPTFKADSTAIKTIVKGNNLPLAPGDIAGGGHWIELQYDTPLDKWVLLNPATGAASTAPQFDNTTRPATTAFVQRALGNYQAGAQITTTTALTFADVGKLIQFSGTTPGQTITLPSLSTVPTGASLAFVNNGTQSVSIARAGGDTIIAGTSSPLTSFALKTGDSAILGYVGGAWFVVSGGIQLANSSSFASSLVSNGWQKLPSGLIIQWGSVGSIAALSSTPVTFPFAFPSGCFSVLSVPTDGNQYNVVPTAISPSGFTLNNKNTQAAVTSNWIAIGL